MKLLVDMNVSPGVCESLEFAGFESAHWSKLGDPAAPDAEILEYARTNGYLLLTHDLDFSAILAATQARGPSVVQVRTQDVLSARFLEVLVTALRQFEAELITGAVLVVDEHHAKVRVLPVR